LAKASAALAILLMTLGGGPSPAQSQAHGRESHVTVYGDDPCPPSSNDEIVVCARRSEDERYRIPAPLRHSGRRSESSWTSHAEELEEVQRESRPDGCSVVGSWGQSGCSQQMVRQWRAERRARAAQRR
jgi:hypothetical protein